MSQRFTVSKSDDVGLPADIQGEVNLLFEGEGEGDKHPSGAESEDDAAGAEGANSAAVETEAWTSTVVTLKGRTLA